MWQLRVLGVTVMTSFLVGGVRAEEVGPVSICTYEGEHIADKASCTRYYKCRQDDVGIFVTDLLVCPDGSVFDMVTNLCNETTTSYWQDPTSCTKFYGCHSTRETSEGFVRQQYVCTGDLRFHPIDRFCTFKTKVPDILCNSRADEQSIIGTDTIYLRNNLPHGANIHIRGRPFRTSSRSGFRTPSTEEGTVERSSSSTTFSGEEEVSTTGRATSPKALKTVDDVSAVALAIKHQLLLRRPPYQGQEVPEGVVTHEELLAEGKEGEGEEVVEIVE